MSLDSGRNNSRISSIPPTGLPLRKREGSSITQAEVTEVVKKLLGDKAPGVNEIRPEYLKCLDVGGVPTGRCMDVSLCQGTGQENFHHHTHFLKNI